MIRYETPNGDFAAMPLAKLLEEQYLPGNPDIASEKTKRRYKRAVAWLSEALKRPAGVADLTDAHLGALVSHLRTSRGQCNRTVNGSLECLRALWRWCRDSDLIRTGPRFANLKVAEMPPKAWREDELVRLVQAADARPGMLGGVPSRVWWLTAIALELDTGARVTELLSLRWEWLDWRSGTITVEASYRKGGTKWGCYKLRQITLDWLHGLGRREGEILPCDVTECTLYNHFTAILKAAGLPSNRYTKFHCLRKTFATLLELNGGNATQALGHASRSTTLRHYLDPSRLVRAHADAIPFHPTQAIGG